MLFWLLDNLNFGAEDTLWLGVPRKLGTNFALKTRLRNEYPSLHLRLIYVDFQTRGAVETLFIILQVKIGRVHSSRQDNNRDSYHGSCFLHQLLAGIKGINQPGGRDSTIERLV